MTAGAEARALSAPERDALAELLLTLADDEFVIGFWDSEWTGIAPMLEEDVATSSIAQDELGHAKALYELLADLTDTDADRIAFGRGVADFRHAPLLDHPRTDWAFTVARRYLYDSADAVRLDALAGSSYAPLAGLSVKMRREETYHLLHWDAWLRRLAAAGGEAGERLDDAVRRLWPDAQAVFAPLRGEATLVEALILPEPMRVLRARWNSRVKPVLDELGFSVPVADPPTVDARGRHGEPFAWLHSQFTMVAGSEEGATW